MQTARIVIVGGGAAGAAAAITLARLGHNPFVLEARARAELKVGESLPPSANLILEQLGLTDGLPRDGHLPSYGNRSVWGSPVPAERDFIFGTQGHGWHLDRLKFESALAARAQEAGVDWRYGCRLLTCSRRNEGWQLSLKSTAADTTLEADFVVDATGRASRLARQCGARRLSYDRLVGAALLFKSRSGAGIREALTLVEAVASGWWYSARLPGEKLMVVYMTDSDLLDHEARATGGWFALLEETEHTLHRVREGDYHPLGAPSIQPANSSRLESVAGQGWIAAGDAASAFDPLSSYGISSALGGGFYAASAIDDYLAGNDGALPSYQKLVGDAYAQYLLLHYEYYSLERRWPDEPFWQRRHARRYSSSQST